MNITVESGNSIRLKTAGKYCTQDIVVTATGGSEDNLGPIISGTIETLESEVSSVRTYAAYKLASLKNVSLPEATVISDYAFNSCENLTNANIPKVTTIGSHAFQNCEALTSID